MELVLQTLERKRAEIIGAIKKHEAAIAQAKHDLAHVSATIRLLESPEGGERAYIVSQGFFAKGEIAGVCQRYLVDGPLTTRELAERVMGEGAGYIGRAVAQLGRLQGRPSAQTRNTAANCGNGREAQRPMCMGFACRPVEPSGWTDDQGEAGPYKLWAITAR